MTGYSLVKHVSICSVVVATLALLVSGCGENVCSPGATQTCECVNTSQQGAQTCNAEGSAWGTCKCPGDTDGGPMVDAGDTAGDGDGSSSTPDTDGGEQGGPVDLLWVLDNSGSMCEEQASLRKNFKRFVDTLRQKPIDFNMAVTTTGAGNFYEVISSAGEIGHIQSTPHPPVGFGQTCTTDERAADTYEPLRTQIEAAVACTKEPGKYEHLTELTDAQIKCALEGNEAMAACQQAGWSPDEVGRAELFPCGDEHGERCETVEQFESVYRDIPNVLSAADYEDANGALDVEKLRNDFACMSYVGTRGEAMEQGLRAAVQAVAPANTGGTIAEPIAEHGGSDAPNHGFLRKEARTGVIFVTDENDCSRPAEIDIVEEFGCGEMGCYYAAAEGRDDQSPLFATQELAEQFLSNLAASKGVDEIDPQDVFVGSIHGDYAKYGSKAGQKVEEDCAGTQGELRKSATVCSTDLGSATSGDRYEDFLRHFENTFPEAPSGGGHMRGWMCEDDLGGALEAIAAGLRGN